VIEKVDGWFLQLAVVGLSGYFLWSIRKILNDFTAQVKRLDETIGKLFDKDDDKERRLSRIEERCNVMHGVNGIYRGGRRYYDPDDRPGEDNHG